MKRVCVCCVCVCVCVYIYTHAHMHAFDIAHYAKLSNGVVGLIDYSSG